MKVSTMIMSMLASFCQKKKKRNVNEYLRTLFKGLKYNNFFNKNITSASGHWHSLKVL